MEKPPRLIIQSMIPVHLLTTTVVHLMIQVVHSMTLVTVLVQVWTNGDMSYLNWALIVLLLFTASLFVFVYILLPKININEMFKLKLTDELAEKIFIRVLVASFSIFMIVFFLTGDLFFILLSQLMTLKISHGFSLYQNWQAEKNNKHSRKQLFLYMLFYIVKPK